MSKRPYVSGPIAGLPEVGLDEKLDRFTRAELSLRRRGYEPVNSLRVAGCPERDCNGDVTRPDGIYVHTWQCRLKYDLIEMLSQADSIAMLPGWETSPGARVEHQVAVALEWEVFDLADDPIVLGLPHEIDRARSGKRPE